MAQPTTGPGSGGQTLSYLEHLRKISEQNRVLAEQVPRPRQGGADFARALEERRRRRIVAQQESGGDLLRFLEGLVEHGGNIIRGLNPPSDVERRMTADRYEELAERREGLQRARDWQIRQQTGITFGDASPRGPRRRGPVTRWDISPDPGPGLPMPPRAPLMQPRTEPIPADAGQAPPRPEPRDPEFRGIHTGEAQPVPEVFQDTDLFRTELPARPWHQELKLRTPNPRASLAAISAPLLRMPSPYTKTIGGIGLGVAGLMPDFQPFPGAHAAERARERRTGRTRTRMSNWDLMWSLLTDKPSTREEKRLAQREFENPGTSIHERVSVMRREPTLWERMSQADPITVGLETAQRLRRTPKQWRQFSEMAHKSMTSRAHRTGAENITNEEARAREGEYTDEHEIPFEVDPADPLGHFSKPMQDAIRRAEAAGEMQPREGFEWSRLQRDPEAMARRYWEENAPMVEVAMVNFLPNLWEGVIKPTAAAATDPISVAKGTAAIGRDLIRLVRPSERAIILPMLWDELKKTISDPEEMIRRRPAELVTNIATAFLGVGGILRGGTTVLGTRAVVEMGKIGRALHTVGRGMSYVGDKLDLPGHAVRLPLSVARPMANLAGRTAARGTAHATGAPEWTGPAAFRAGWNYWDDPVRSDRFLDQLREAPDSDLAMKKSVVQAAETADRNLDQRDLAGMRALGSDDVPAMTAQEYQRAQRIHRNREWGDLEVLEDYRSKQFDELNRLHPDELAERAAGIKLDPGIRRQLNEKAKTRRAAYDNQYALWKAANRRAPRIGAVVRIGESSTPYIVTEALGAGTDGMPRFKLAYKRTAAERQADYAEEVKRWEQRVKDWEASGTPKRIPIVGEHVRWGRRAGTYPVKAVIDDGQGNVLVDMGGGPHVKLSEILDASGKPYSAVEIPRKGKKPPKPTPEDVTKDPGEVRFDELRDKNGRRYVPEKGPRLPVNDTKRWRDIMTIIARTTPLDDPGYVRALDKKLGKTDIPRATRRQQRVEAELEEARAARTDAIDDPTKHHPHFVENVRRRHAGQARRDRTARHFEDLKTGRTRKRRKPGPRHSIWDIEGPSPIESAYEASKPFLDQARNRWRTAWQDSPGVMEGTRRVFRDAGRFLGRTGIGEAARRFGQKRFRPWLHDPEVQAQRSRGRQARRDRMKESAGIQEADLEQYRTTPIDPRQILLAADDVLSEKHFKGRRYDDRPHTKQRWSDGRSSILDALNEWSRQSPEHHTVGGTMALILELKGLRAKTKTGGFMSEVLGDVIDRVEQKFLELAPADVVKWMEQQKDRRGQLREFTETFSAKDYARNEQVIDKLRNLGRGRNAAKAASRSDLLKSMDAPYIDDILAGDAMSYGEPQRGRRSSMQWVPGFMKGLRIPAVTSPRMAGEVLHGIGFTGRAATAPWRSIYHTQRGPMAASHIAPLAERAGGEEFDQTGMPLIRNIPTWFMRQPLGAALAATMWGAEKYDIPDRYVAEFLKSLENPYAFGPYTADLINTILAEAYADDPSLSLVPVEGEQ